MKDINPRLGRGLASLLGDPASRSEKEPIGEISVALLGPSPFQPRGPIDPASLAELTDSIRARGLLQPLLVRPHPTQPSRYEIIAGERRWRAAQAAGLTAVPCLIRPMTDADATAAALVENLQRKDLNPIEEAEGFKRLIEEFNLTQDELGTAIGKSRSHVANLLRLLQLPPNAIAYLKSGALTAGHARAALACANPAEAAETIVAKGLSVREAEMLSQAKPATSPASSKKPALPDPDLQAVEADLAERLGLHVQISFNGTGGLIRLRYQTLEQLDHVIAQLSRS
ncbi:MAG: ParB/RepB/Spo0J family partition protein [Acetobacteraceae bacterium]